MYITAQGMNTTRVHEVFKLKHPEGVAKALMQACSVASKSSEHTTIENKRDSCGLKRMGYG